MYSDAMLDSLARPNTTVDAPVAKTKTILEIVDIHDLVQYQDAFLNSLIWYCAFGQSRELLFHTSCDLRYSNISSVKGAYQRIDCRRGPWKGKREGIESCRYHIRRHCPLSAV